MVKACPLVHGTVLLCPHRAEEVQELSAVSGKGTHPTNHLLKAPSPKTTLLGTRISHMNCGGDTNIQTLGGSFTGWGEV